MDLAALVAQYGYWAVFLGTLLEGETVLVLAGVAAHQGYLSLPLVMAVAFAGSLLGDQFFFFLGRRHAAWVLRRLESWRLPLEAVQDRLERHQVKVMLGFRFVYGLRMATPVVIGLSSIRAGRFALFNALGAAIWSVAVSGAGYAFGSAVSLFLEKAKYAQMAAFGLVLAVVLGAWALRRLRRRKRATGAPRDPDGPR